MSKFRLSPLASVIFQKAFELASSGKEKLELGPDNPVIDADAGDQGINVILKCYLFESFTPEYKFPLNPDGVEVDPIVSIASQLRDAKEEIAELKAENVKLRGYMERRNKGFFSLSSATNTTQNQVVVWNGTAPRELSELVTLSADNKTLKIVQPGVYQIYLWSILALPTIPFSVSERMAVLSWMFPPTPTRRTMKAWTSQRSFVSMQTIHWMCTFMATIMLVEGKLPRVSQEFTWQSKRVKLDQLI